MLSVVMRCCGALGPVKNDKWLSQFQVTLLMMPSRSKPRTSKAASQGQKCLGAVLSGLLAIFWPDVFCLVSTAVEIFTGFFVIG